VVAPSAVRKPTRRHSYPRNYQNNNWLQFLFVVKAAALDVDKISTDTARRAVPLRQLSFLLFKEIYAT